MLRSHFTRLTEFYSQKFWRILIAAFFATIFGLLVIMANNLINSPQIYKWYLGDWLINYQRGCSAGIDWRNISPIFTII